MRQDFPGCSSDRYCAGCSFAAGGYVYSESQFRQTAAQTSASLMTLSCITLVIPAACKSPLPNVDETFADLPSDHSTYLRGHENQGKSHSSFDKENPEHAPNPKDDSLAGLLKLSRGTSIILLTVYFIYLYFQVRPSPTHLHPANCPIVLVEIPPQVVRGRTSRATGRGRGRGGRGCRDGHVVCWILAGGCYRCHCVLCGCLGRVD